MFLLRFLMVSLGSCIHTLILSPSANEYELRYKQWGTSNWTGQLAERNWKNRMLAFTEQAAASTNEKEKYQLEKTVEVMKDFGFKLFEYTHTQEGRFDLMKHVLGGDDYFDDIEMGKGEYDDQINYAVKHLGPNGRNDWSVSLKIDHLGEAVLGSIRIHPLDDAIPNYRQDLLATFNKFRARIFKVDCSDRWCQGWWIQWNKDKNTERLLTRRFIHHEFKSIAWLLLYAKEESEKKKMIIHNSIATYISMGSDQEIATVDSVTKVTAVVMSYFGLSSFYYEPEKSVVQEIPEAIKIAELSKTAEEVLPEIVPEITTFQLSTQSDLTIVESVMGYLGSFISSKPENPKAEVISEEIMPEVSEKERYEIFLRWDSIYGNDNFF